MKIMILISCFLTFSALGNLKKFKKELLRENKNLKIANKNLEIAYLEKGKYGAQFDWALQGSLGYSDRFKDSLLSFQSLRTLNNSFSLSLVKPFSWGGEVVLTQGLVKYNLSHWGLRGGLFTSGSVAERPWEYFGKISYTQSLGKNLFGKIFQLDEEIISTEIEIEKKEIEVKREEMLYSLALYYLKARYHETALNSIRKSLRRYERRLSLIKRRVKDGLSLDVDLVQSESEYISLKEVYEKEKTQKEEVLKNLSLLLEREVVKGEILPYSQKLKREKFWENWVLGRNLTLEKMGLKLEKIKKVIKKNKQMRWPDIKLRASLGTNAMDHHFRQAFKEGGLNSRYQEKEISLNLNIPLGGGAAKIEMEKSKIRGHQQEIYIKRIKKEIALKFESLKRKIRLYWSQVSLSERQLLLSKTVREKYENLYLQGRVNLDILLNAEDKFNENERGYFQNRFFYESLLLEYALVTNHLLDFYQRYEDLK